MNATEFKTAFETRFYAATTVNSLGWTDDEISEFLNYGLNSSVILAAESGDLEAVSNLVKSGELTVSTTPNNERRYAANISGFYYLISAELVAPSGTYPMEKIKQDEIVNFKVTPYNAAIFRKPKIAVDDSLGNNYPTFVVLQGGLVPGTPTKMLYRILVKPTAIDISGNIGTNVNEILHDKIVDIAVAKAVETYLKTQQSSQ